VRAVLAASERIDLHKVARRSRNQRQEGAPGERGRARALLP
jgi:hypothetical protein